MNFMVLGAPGILYGHSLLGGARILYVQHMPPVAAVLKPYTIVSLLSLPGISYVVVFRIRELWRRVAVIVMSLNLLPYTSTDYKLLHIYIPMFLFINAITRDRLDRVYALLFALLLAPKYYVYLFGNP